MLKRLAYCWLLASVAISAQAQSLPEVKAEASCAPNTVVAGSWLLEGIEPSPTWSAKVSALLQAQGLQFRQSGYRSSRFVIQASSGTVAKLLKSAKKAWGKSYTADGEETVWAEPLGMVRACGDAALPNDPLLAQQWWWQNTGQEVVPWSDLYPLQGHPGSDVQVAAAWPSLVAANNSITVGLIDTGVDYSHPDLVGSLLAGKNLLSSDPLALPQDDNGHGTLMAGVIAASSNNALGIAGLAPASKILPVKALNSSQQGLISDVVDGLDYLVAQNVPVINLSWATGQHSKSLRAAIVRALKANVLVVASAGNGYVNLDKSPLYPARFNFKKWLDGLLVVAAADSWDFLHPISNFGAKSVDLVAPGGAVLSTYPVAFTGTLPPYAFSVGSSTASAVVAGAAAAVKALAPELGAKQLKLRLLGSVDTVSNLSNKVKSGGRVNVARAVLLAPAAPPSASGKVKWKTLPKKGANKCSCTVNGVSPATYSSCLISQSTPFYSNDLDLKLRLSCPGAKQIRLDMAVDIEPLHDVLFLNSGQGELGVDLVSGSWKEYRSVPVPGDEVELNLRSDNITVGKGFKILSVQVQ